MKIGKKKNIVEKKFTPSKGGITASASKKQSVSAKKDPNAGDKGSSAVKAKKEPKFERERRFMTYLYRVLKKNWPDYRATQDGLETLNGIILDFYDELASQAREVSMKSKKQTLTAQDVQTAAKLFLPQDIALHAIDYATKAVQRFADANEKEE